MNWYKQLNKLLGFFWLHVWKDSWLTEMLGKFLHFIVGRNLFNRIQSIQKQTACSSLYTQDHVRYIPIYIDSDSGSYFGISRTSTQFNQTTADITKLLYTKCPDWLQFSVSQTKNVIPRSDFDWEAGNISNSKQGIIKIKTDISKYMTNNTLWAVYNSYNTLLDRFTGIMQLPTQWIYKYPGSIQAAWSIKQNGANQRDVMDLLSAIGGISNNPFINGPCQLPVTFSSIARTEDPEYEWVFHYQNKLQPLPSAYMGWRIYVRAKDTSYVYKYCEYDAYNQKFVFVPHEDVFMNPPDIGVSVRDCKVFFGSNPTQSVDLAAQVIDFRASQLNTNGTERIDVDAELCIQCIHVPTGQFPSVWTYKTGLPDIIQGIHVITGSGVLYARRIDDSSFPCLPLRTDINDSIDEDYENKCSGMNSDSSILYTQLQSSDIRYPADFIFNRVWGPNAVLIVTAPVTNENRKDTLTAIKFIYKNMSVGAVLLAYTPEQELLYPDRQEINSLLRYYEKAINNNTQVTYKQHI